MFEIVSLRKADKDKPPHFELVYVDLEKQANQKGYFMSTEYGKIRQLRSLGYRIEPPNPQPSQARAQ
jgi:hypothetical protein